MNDFEVDSAVYIQKCGTLPAPPNSTQPTPPYQYNRDGQTDGQTLLGTLSPSFTVDKNSVQANFKVLQNSKATSDIVYNDNYLGQLLFMLGGGGNEKIVGISWYSLLNVPVVYMYVTILS